jgi:hypothetical protein
MDGGVNYAERINLAFENQVFEWKQAEGKCPRLISRNRQKYVCFSNVSLVSVLSVWIFCSTSLLSCKDITADD